MKTSNLILAIFFGIIALGPLGLFISLKSKLARNEYRVEHSQKAPMDKTIKQVFNTPKLVRIKGGGSVDFHCYLIPSDSNYYSYEQKPDEHPGFQIRQSADTLFASWQPKDSTDTNDDEKTIAIHLRDWQKLDADNATVHLDSLSSAAGTRQVELKNEAELVLGSGVSQQLLINREK